MSVQIWVDLVNVLPISIASKCSESHFPTIAGKAKINILAKLFAESSNIISTTKEFGNF